MNNLTPEVRHDKNGNAVTRWIRSLGRKNTDTKIPAPALATVTSPTTTNHHEQSVMELYGILQPIHHYNPASRLAMNLTTIAQSDTRLLQQITKATRDSTVESEYWEDKIERSGNLHRETPDVREAELNGYRLALIINPLLRRIIKHDPISYMHKVEPHLYLDALTGILEDGGIITPPEDLAKAVVIIACIKQFHRDDWTETGGITYESIAADAAYIADHFDQVEELLPELQLRDTHDRDTIAVLLNNEAQVLREGEL